MSILYCLTHTHAHSLLLLSFSYTTENFFVIFVTTSLSADGTTTLIRSARRLSSKKLFADSRESFRRIRGTFAASRNPRGVQGDTARRREREVCLSPHKPAVDFSKVETLSPARPTDRRLRISKFSGDSSRGGGSRFSSRAAPRSVSGWSIVGVVPDDLLLFFCFSRSPIFSFFFNSNKPLELYWRITLVSLDRGKYIIEFETKGNE